MAVFCILCTVNGLRKTHTHPGTMGNKHTSPADVGVSRGGRKQQLQMLQQQQSSSLRRMHERMRALAAERQQQLGESALSGELMHRPATPDTDTDTDTDTDEPQMPMPEPGSKPLPSMGGRFNQSDSGSTLTFDSREGRWKFTDSQ